MNAHFVFTLEDVLGLAAILLACPVLFIWAFVDVYIIKPRKKKRREGRLK